MPELFPVLLRQTLGAKKSLSLPQQHLEILAGFSTHSTGESAGAAAPEAAEGNGADISQCRLGALCREPGQRPCLRPFAAKVLGGSSKKCWHSPETASPLSLLPQPSSFSWWLFNPVWSLS